MPVTTDAGPVWTGPTVSGTVAVNPAMTVGAIGAGFVGLSYEKSHLTTGFLAKSNVALVALMKLLGPSVLRIGGNSVDVTTWSPSAPAGSGGAVSTTIGTADVDGLADLLAATGWTTIYAVGLKHSTPAAAATEATYAASKLGSALLGFEIGNEIDLYGLSYQAMLANWNAEADAVRAAVPNAPLTGPAMAAHGLVPSFAKDEAARLSLLTQHHYRADGTSATSTMAELLAPDPNLIAVLPVLQTAVSANHIAGGFRMDECNSYFNHGAPGVSDALGSALWVIDFLFANASFGAAGVNFHGGGAGQDGTRPFYYTPIEESSGVVAGAQPMFYGMLLFTLAGTGNLLSTTAKAGALNFTAYAVSQADGSTQIALVNKDATSGVQASIDVGATVGTASAMYLQGPSLTALTGVTLAGQGISSAGAWSPSVVQGLPVNAHTVTVTLPPATAAIVHAQ